MTAQKHFFLASLLLLGRSVAHSQGAAPQFITVSAASFAAGPLAPESIVTGQGSNLATTTSVAPAGNLPTTLGGVNVEIIDTSRASSAAPLYFVSPSQINFLIPPGVRSGPATISVRRGQTELARGTVQIDSVSPGLFSAAQTGSGLAAGRVNVVSGDSATTSQFIADCTSPGRCVPIPIVVADSSSAVYLELYGTGIRGRSGLSAVTASISGVALEVLYAGPQGQYPGLDQVNVRIPTALISSGVGQVILTVDGRQSNPISLQLGGTAPTQVSVRFDPAAPGIGPFPTDALTVPDARQKTGLRVNLPLPDCDVQTTTCNTYGLLNEFDGFNLQPRITVRFSGPVDTGTVRNGIRIIWLENLTAEERGLQPVGHLTGIDRVIVDPTTNTVYAKPDEPMDQHRRYALVITDAVRDALGNPVAADTAFRNCITLPATDYCRELALVQPMLTQVPGQIVAATTFTTLSATSWAERARAVVENTPANLTRVANINFKGLATATLRGQTGVNPPTFEDSPLPPPALIASGLDRAVFGTFTSPNFLDARQSIPIQPTSSPLTPNVTAELPFHAFVPSTSKPAAGYPVVIFGHGLTDSRFGGPTVAAGALVKAGFVMLAINAVGHGLGPQTELVVTNSMGQSMTIPAPGRGVDIDGNGQITRLEGCVSPASGVLVRDCLRQTAVDLMQLVHAIRGGFDLDGDGSPDLDGSRIYYAGQSLGTLYGTIFSAVTPEVRAIALNVGGGPVADIGPISTALKPLLGFALASHVPPLLNLPPLPNNVPNFNSNPVFRGEPVRINTVSGALEIQNYLELLEWLNAVGDPIPFAPHLRLSPLTGVPEKRLLLQIARGDQVIPNPANSNLIRNAGGQGATVLYRHDIARQNSEGLAVNPHEFLFAPLQPPPGLAVALAAQTQIAGFFASDGMLIPEANSAALEALFRGNKVFERPTSLPEDLGFSALPNP